MMNAIAGHPSIATTNTEFLLEIIMAAAVALPEAIRAVGEALRCPRIACPFGMSEGTPITYHPFKDLPVDFSDEGISTGPCCPGARARICVPNSHKLIEIGAVGELHIGGPMVVPGYLRRTSDELYSDDGTHWMITGDQARMDSRGEVYIMGWYKDVIIRAGENISPASIEAVLDSIPGVTSQVVGVADKVAGEVPVAVLKVADGVEVHEDTMHDVLSTRLGPVFTPAHTLRVGDLGLDDFPKTESGKYQKFELRGPVAEYIMKKEEPPSATKGNESSDRDALHQIWARLLGMSTDKLSVTAPIQDIADSITVMRAINKIKRELGRSIGAYEILEYPTIQAQAQLLSNRNSTCKERKSKPVQTRRGPPEVSDMAHTLGSEERHSDVKAAFGLIGDSMGLTWERDVEDVFPVWDWGQVMLCGPRAQSWNHRHAFATTQAGPEKLRTALERALSYQAMLRTLAVRPKGSDPVHVVIRSSSRWYEHVITEVDEVATAEDLPRLALNDPELDFATAPGPLFRAIIAPIKDSNTCGLVYQAHHSCFDGLSLPNLIDDLETILEHGSTDAAIAPRTSYKGFADNLFLHRSSAQAQIDCDFHVQRLKGLSNHQKVLWPFQRAPEWFKGNFADIADRFPDRKALDGDQSIGVDGVKGSIELPGVQQLKTDHGLSAPAILKTALALLNCHYTSGKTAVFTNYEAGREWAFQEPWIADLLPNAMDVNGPTLEAVLNNISLRPSETCLAMMQRVHEEQKLLTRHAHAPLLEIKQQLGEDGAELIEIMRRQIFNWLPGLQSDMQEQPGSPLRRMQMQSRSDVGLLWNCGMVGDTFHVTASYDDAQLRATEVEEAVERWFAIAKWITESANWSSAVELCPTT